MKVSIATMRNNLAELLNRAAYAGERVVLQRRGKPVAALVSMDDLELLERLEDEEDLKAVREAREEMRRTGEKPIPWEEVKNGLGL